MQTALNRKQSVVFFSDIVGYTRLMGQDENAAFELMKENLKIHQEIFQKYRGQVVKELGDGILGIFETPNEAINAAFEIQQFTRENQNFQLRIGMHSGDVIFDHGDVFGDAVNQSSRIQSVGTPSSILISETLHNELGTQSKFSTIKLGAFELKNVEKEVMLFAITNPPLNVPKRTDILKNIKYQERNPWMKWVLILVVFALIGGISYELFWNGTPWSKEKSIVVLPFENLSKDQTNDYFSEGLTDDVIFQLTEIDSLQVIPYEQVNDLTNPNISLDSISKLFEVTTLLKGSVDFIGSKVQVNVRLIDLSNATNIWSETFTRESTGIVSIQNTIAKEIARALNANMSSQELYQIGKTPTSSALAYDLYLKGKSHYYKYEKEENLNAISFFHQAIELDPNYALAYSGLADSYAQMPNFGYGMTWLDSSKDANEKALIIDPTLAEAYMSRGITYYYQGKNDYAKISFEKALAYKPNLSRAVGNLATIYFSQGDLVNSLRLQAKSSAINPKAFLPYQISGWIYRILGDSDNSEFYLNKALEFKNDPINFEQLGYTLISIGKTKEASSLIPTILNEGNDANTISIAGLLAYYLQDLDLAKEYFEQSIQLKEDYQNDPYFIVPINLAYILKLKGETSQSNKLLESAIELRMDSMLEGDEDYNLPLDLAIAKVIKGENREVAKYLNLAFDRGWRDIFLIEQNPAFADYKKSNDFAQIARKIQDNLIEQNQKLKSTSLQRDK
jgi:class 3 adenylate cyclase/TolB-like protein/Flp pilus assembly protein TadD